MASALHVSGYHLSHVFSRESNFSLFAYLTAVRMEKAKALLAEGELTVSQVAHAVGYATPNYFSKVFRKQCGCGAQRLQRVVAHAFARFGPVLRDSVSETGSLRARRSGWTFAAGYGWLLCRRGNLRSSKSHSS